MLDHILGTAQNFENIQGTPPGYELRHSTRLVAEVSPEVLIVRQRRRRGRHTEQL